MPPEMQEFNRITADQIMAKKQECSAHSPCVLIVDDKPENLLAMEVLLDDLDATLICVESGKEALESVKQHDFALVLLDVQMPCMNGYEVAEQLRLNSQTKHVPIIFVTANDKDDDSMFKGYELGAVDYLFKPINPLMLKSKVSVFLELDRKKGIEEILEKLHSSQLKAEEANRNLEKLAHYDVLTGLPNRAYFETKIKSVLSTAREKDSLCALMIIDVDNFKLVNDSFGHPVGDLLLSEVAKKLVKVLRDSDFVARIGGDEFAIIIENINYTIELQAISKKIITELDASYLLDGHEVGSTVSIGISCYPFAGKEPEEFIKNADIALYRAKGAGRNIYQYFSPEIQKICAERINLENMLKIALQKNEFHLVYQPIFNIQTQCVVGVEALIRWQQPEVGLIPPDEFIPLAEEVGCISKIDQWVMQQACRDYPTWAALFDTAPSLSVNLSANRLHDEGFIPFVEGLLAEKTIAPNNLVVELTETALMKKVEKSTLVIAHLDKMGIQIAIDDFGTGYSSLERLKILPVKELKIDKSFVDDMLTDDETAMIVNAIIALSHKMKISVVAEGIEEESQMGYLAANGCGYGQGYLYAKPMKLEDLLKFLKA